MVSLDKNRNLYKKIIHCLNRLIYVPLCFTVLPNAVSLEIIWIVEWVIIIFAHLIMQFKVTFINTALICKGFSFSHPLHLQATSWKLVFLHLTGSSHKTKVGLIVGIVAGLGVIFFLGCLLFFWYKGFKREIFVDVPGLSSFFSLHNVFVDCL